ncbi:MAG: Gfo/Idh/MocA family oxidoreductase [Endomicrobia bacterium]|nr:Gfo/Idh/MocA family oxidoreductase [Endomicrobiia bacterium]
MIKIGIIGLGHWGVNYLRIFSHLRNSKVIAAAEKNRNKIKKLKILYPDIKFYEDYREIIKNLDIDAIVIATPTSTHYEITKGCLENNKDVLVEKPLSVTEKEAEELVELAQKKKLILMVGHTFLYNDCVIWLKKYIEKKCCGKIYYMHALRTNLGPIRTDVNSIYDLATHDISIFVYLLNSLPEKISALGGTFLKKVEDVGFIVLYFSNNVVGHIHVSWLDPCKIRRVTVVGEKKMIVFDDVATLEPIRIYNKGVIKEKQYRDFGEFHMVLRDGNVTIPKINASEPLKNQCEMFLHSVANRIPPVSDGIFGYKIVKVLEAAIKSISLDGVLVKI